MSTQGVTVTADMAARRRASVMAGACRARGVAGAGFARDRAGAVVAADGDRRLVRRRQRCAAGDRARNPAAPHDPCGCDRRHTRAVRRGLAGVAAQSAGVALTVRCAAVGRLRRSAGDRIRSCRCAILGASGCGDHGGIHLGIRAAGGCGPQRRTVDSHPGGTGDIEPGGGCDRAGDESCPAIRSWCSKSRSGCSARWRIAVSAMSCWRCRSSSRARSFSGASATLFARSASARRRRKASASMSAGCGFWVILGIALGVGGAVAVAGTIGFIGLVAPHLMRPLIGHDPARLLVPSALTGAALLLAADIAVTDHSVDQRYQGRGADLDHRRAVFPLPDHARTARARRRCRMTASAFLSAQGMSVVLAGRLVLNDVSLVAAVRTFGGTGGAERRRQDHAAARRGGAGSFSGAIHVGGDALASLVLARARATFCLSAAGPHHALAAAGAGYRGARSLPAWCDRPGAFDAERCRGGIAGDARNRCRWNSASVASPNYPAASAAAWRWRASLPSKRR